MNGALMMSISQKLVCVLLTIIAGIIYLLTRGASISHDQSMMLRESTIKTIDMIGSGFGVHFSQFIPIYYINLQRSPERRQHMERKFKDGFPSDRTVMKSAAHEMQPRRLQRVSAVDGNNLGELEDVLYYEDESTTPEDLLLQYSATHGEVALTMSHFKAIKQAYEDDIEVVLILEDDAGDELTYFWIHTPEDLVAMLDGGEGDLIDGYNWSMIRLQYTLRQGYSELQNLWRDSPHHTHFMEGKSCCFGTVAQLVSRRGMIEILNAFEISDNKFDCSGVMKQFRFNSTFRCASDHVLPAAMSRVLIAMPPLFSIRLLEGSTGVRCKKRGVTHCEAQGNKKYHQQSLVTSLKWAVESRAFMDMASTGDVEISLPAYQWVVT